MNHAISLQEAIQLTRFLRQNRETLLNPSFGGNNTIPTAESFDREAIEKLLSQADCTGIRIYYGMDENLQLRMVLVGINKANDDILPEDLTTADGTILEKGYMCPPVCGTTSLLSS